MSSASIESAGSSVVNNEKTTTSAAKNSLLDKDAFLKILVTQLANQDPLEPLDQSEFISQMAQFTQVEQTANMEDRLESLGQYMKFSSASLINSNISYADEEDLVEKTGTVRSVIFEADETKVRLDSGLEISADRITGLL